MSTPVVRVRPVRKPSLVLVKGGRGQPASPPLTEADRYPRFPPAWVDWLVLGLGLAALNLPSPIPLLSVGGIVVIELLLARRIKQEGGEDPNIPDGVAMFFSPLFTDIRLKKPLERKLPPITPFTKQIVIFALCEGALYFLRAAVPFGLNRSWQNFLTLLLFVVVAGVGLKALLWWDTSR